MAAEHLWDIRSGFINDKIYKNTWGDSLLMLRDSHKIKYYSDLLVRNAQG